MALATIIGTDLLSQFLSSGDREAQDRLEQEAYRLYGDISPPTLERVLQERLGPSAMEGISEDFGNRGARNAALQRMVEMGLSGGMDAESQLAVEQARRAAAAQETAGRGAVRQEFQRRGLGGAGEASLQLQAQQAGADRAALTDMQAAGDARSRALQALSAGGSMAAQAEGQDFDRAARIAQSEDEIARFNAELATGAIQQDYQNRLGLADRRYGATQRYGDYKGGKADATRKRIGHYGQAIDEGLASAGSAGNMAGPAMRGGYAGQGQEYTQPVQQGYDPNDPRYRGKR